jgi:acyl-CoA synthetase (AMP-forming)/AMP-acid ligase II
VIGIPSERWGESVHAIVVLREAMTTTAEDIIAFCRGRIAGYKCPRSVEIRQGALPMNAAGKIQKARLREPFWAGRQRKI